MIDSMSRSSVPNFRHSGKFHFHSGILGLVLLANLVGCSLDNPLGRSLGWFGYLDAADIRDNCAGRTGERYRLVYNAVWGEQVRSYDVTAAPGDVPASLAVRVFFPENLNQINLRDPLELFRGQLGTVALSPADMAAFRRSLRASDFETATPRGLILRSNSFYWVVAACRDGVFHYNAYAYPSVRFAAIRFDSWLFEHDPTGVAVASPGQAAEDVSHAYFEMMLGADGLVGVQSLF
jgi:hypothetical protein